MEFANWLVVAGGILELLAVAAVAWGIGRDLRHARDLLADSTVSGPPRFERYAWANPRDTRRSQIAGPHKVVKLRDLDLLENRVVNEIGALERRIDTRDDEIFNELLDEIVKGDNELRADLKEALSQGTRWRIGGVVALAVGIALTAVGAVLPT